MLFSLLLFVFSVRANSPCWLMIDPGHGGKDFGTSYFALKEKNITLEYAQLLEKMLSQQKKGVVRLTRHDDRFIGIDQRRKEGQDSACLRMISFHVNGYIDPKRWGTEIYFGELSAPPWKEQLDVSDYMRMIDEFKVRLQHQSSKRWAFKLRDQLRKAFPKRPIRIGKMPLTILQQTNMPSLLIEIGYLSNEEDRQLLIQKDFQNQFVSAVLESLMLESGKDLPRN